MLTIDRTRCRRDGLCGEVCPMGLIATDDEGSPLFRQEGASLCIACGHCVAVCPKEALGHDKVPQTDLSLPRPAETVSATVVAQLIQNRRSIREFRAKPVSRELIEEAIEAARWAPSATNQQPVHWLVIQNPAEVRRLAGLVADSLRQSDRLGERYATIVDQWDQGNDLILRNAPHLVVAHAPEEWPWSTVDCTIALTQFELVATGSGIGTCWAGFLCWAARQSPMVKEALGLPAGHGVFGALMLGLPRYRYRGVPPRLPARVEWR